MIDRRLEDTSTRPGPAGSILIVLVETPDGIEHIGATWNGELGAFVADIAHDRSSPELVADLHREARIAAKESGGIARVVRFSVRKVVETFAP